MNGIAFPAATSMSGPPSAAAQEATHVDRRVALWSILAFWVFYYVLNTARMALDAYQKNQLDMLPRRAGVTVAGILLTLVIYAILRRLEGRSMRVMLTTAFLTAI